MVLVSDLVEVNTLWMVWGKGPASFFRIWISNCPCTCLLKSRSSPSPPLNGHKNHPPPLPFPPSLPPSLHPCIMCVCVCVSLLFLNRYACIGPGAVRTQASKKVPMPSPLLCSLFYHFCFEVLLVPHLGSSSSRGNFYYSQALKVWVLSLATRQIDQQENADTTVI